MAQLFGVLSEAAPIAQAVNEAWGIYQNSSVAAALSPEDLAITNLRNWIAQWWDVKIKKIGAEGISRGSGEAFGWYDDTAIYIPSVRLADAAGGALPKEQVARTLDRRSLLARRDPSQSKKRLTVKYIRGVGEVQAYALSLKRFRMSSADDEFVSEVNSDG